LPSDEIDNIVNLSQNVEIDHITIIPKDGSTINIGPSDLIGLEVNKSAQSYVDKCYFRVNNKSRNIFPLFGVDSEVKIVADAKYKPRDELFYGIVKKRQRRWDKPKNVDFTEVWGLSFATIASLKMLYSWGMNYKNGYGEVIENLSKQLSFDSKCIKEKNDKGYLYFDHMSILDVMRFLAYQKGWCLFFQGKTIKFGPCEKPQHSGVTINLQDQPTGTITEG